MKEYLGDSVYADFDGYYVIITTENGELGDPSNIIYLEYNVMQALMRYYNNLDEKVDTYEK